MDFFKYAAPALLSLIVSACVPPAAQPAAAAVKPPAPTPPPVICYFPQNYEWLADDHTGALLVKPKCADGFDPSFMRMVEPGAITAMPRCCPAHPGSTAASHAHPLTSTPAGAPAPAASIPAPQAATTAPAAADAPKPKEKTK